MVQGVQDRKKKYVEVVSRTDADGVVVPLKIIWDDGTTYDIDRIFDMRRAASLKVGGTGTRYLVSVMGRNTYLFYEDPRWFVEEKVRG